MHRIPLACFAGLVLALSALALDRDVAAQQRPTSSWWSKSVEKSLVVAGDNRPAIEAALRRVPTDSRPAMSYLVAHMPARDLRALEASFLLETVALAEEARRVAPWGSALSPELYLNEVLPYANVTETRERWRPEFRRRFLPLVADCKTPGEAAQVLNRKIFSTLGVRYSTKRRRADQSPSESIASGLASCTGLSILLVNACRSVGVPARLAGIPSWVNKRGNHTWVEVWDGRWRFLGAAEPGEFDRTWFARDAALAKEDSREHSIYAVSYKKTGVTFPMVWSRGTAPVPATNVTRRYVVQDEPRKDRAATGETEKTRVMIRVRARNRGPRVVADVRLVDVLDPKRAWSGVSKGESNDTNDILAFDVPKRRRYEITVTRGGAAKRRIFEARDDPQDLIEIVLEDERRQRLRRAASGWFAADPGDRKDIEFDAELEEFSRSDEHSARLAVWEAYRASKQHDALRKDHAALRVRSGAHTSPYTLEKVGKKPLAGWPLFIAMHGGGGVAKRVNDSQWKHMQVYYREQASVQGYLYLALRAPNDEWNGFYDHYVWPLVEQLIRQCLVCEDVDPDKVFLMGYSHGGYGAFAIGPNLADRFAAIHASAAAPTGGISPAANLRNVQFTYMIGERDTRYGRLARCKQFDAEIRKLRGDRTEIYPVTMQYEAGHGHTGLPDKDKIDRMYPALRQACPREVTWRPTGDAVRSFYWLHHTTAAAGQSIEASCRDNVVRIAMQNVEKLTVGLDSRLVDLDQPVRIEINGVEVARRKLVPSLRVLCESMWRRGDPRLSYTCEWPDRG